MLPVPKRLWKLHVCSINEKGEHHSRVHPLRETGKFSVYFLFTDALFVV